MLEYKVDRVYSPRMLTRLDGVQETDREFWRLRKSQLIPGVGILLVQQRETGLQGQLGGELVSRASAHFLIVIEAGAEVGAIRDGAFEIGVERELLGGIRISVDAQGGAGVHARGAAGGQPYG
jgi:hypothetical protein